MKFRARASHYLQLTYKYFCVPRQCVALPTHSFRLCGRKYRDAFRVIAIREVSILAVYAPMTRRQNAVRSRQFSLSCMIIGSIASDV